MAIEENNDSTPYDGNQENGNQGLELPRNSNEVSNNTYTNPKPNYNKTSLSTKLVPEVAKSLDFISVWAWHTPQMHL